MAKWLPLQKAFARTVEVEGGEELAFQRLCALIVNGHVKVQCARRKAEWPTDQDKVNVIAATEQFWRFVTLRLDWGEFSIEEREIIGTEDVLIVGNKFEVFTLSQWEVFADSASLEKALISDADVAQTDVIKLEPASSVRKASGGAPLKYDWAAAAAVAAAFVVQNDPTKTDVVCAIEEWFSDQGREPADGEVRKFVAAMFRQMKAPKGKA